MAVKTFPNLHLGHKVKLGRRRPKYRGRAIRPMQIRGTLPTPPASCDYSGRVTGGGMTDIFLNDSLGDCVEAMLARVG